MFIRYVYATLNFVFFINESKSNHNHRYDNLNFNYVYNSGYILFPQGYSNETS